MALGTLWTIITFIVGLVISTIIIFIVTKLFGERESIKIAFITAVIGAVIYSVIYYLLGNGLVGSDCWWNCMANFFKMVIQDKLVKIDINCSNHMDHHFNNWCFVTDSFWTIIK